MGNHNVWGTLKDSGCCGPEHRPVCLAVEREEKSVLKGTREVGSRFQAAGVRCIHPLKEDKLWGRDSQLVPVLVLEPSAAWPWGQ